MDNNIKDQLIAYIKGQLQLGVQESVILNAIKSNGWTDRDYYELAAAAKAQMMPVPKVSEVPPAVKPVEVFAQSRMTGNVQAVSPTKQKSRVGRTIFIIIVCLIVLGIIFYTYENKNIITSSVPAPTANNSQVSSNSLKTFTESSGGFSFQYSPDFVVTEGSSTGILIAKTDDPSKPVSEISLIASSSALQYGQYYYGNGNLILKTVTSRGYNVYALAGTSSQSNTMYTSPSLYFISIPNIPAYYLAVIIIPNTDGVSYDQIFPIMDSMTIIDPAKLISQIEASLETARGKGSDAAAKSAMANFMAEAALYYDDSGKQSYSPVGTTLTSCNTTSGVFSDSMAKKIIANIISNSTSVACRATSQTYAISAVLKGAGTNWCVDNNGDSIAATIQPDGLCK